MVDADACACHATRHESLSRASQPVIDTLHSSRLKNSCWNKKLRRNVIGKTRSETMRKHENAMTLALFSKASGYYVVSLGPWLQVGCPQHGVSSL
eukprot:1140672-Amphidinium_carterae.1